MVYVSDPVTSLGTPKQQQRQNSLLRHINPFILLLKGRILAIAGSILDLVYVYC
jgi:hypothetical protein